LYPGLNVHIYLVKSIPMRSYLALNRSIRSEISLRNSNGSKLVRCYTVTLRWLRLAALLYILRRKRHLSIQRKKLYLRMSSVLLNTGILAIYGHGL
jgi:hypothetical protein